ncbi:MAG: 2-hydroxyacyl-CoA dehydratase family protein [Thermodesulfobacteriota bacterium]
MAEQSAGPAAIGVFCSYVPLELIEATGFRPQLITGLEAERSDPRLPANLCSYVRRCATFLDSQVAQQELSGLIVTDSCFPMLRLWDNIQERANFPFQYLLKVPRLNSQSAIDFFGRELEQLAEDLSLINGIAFDKEKLYSAIELYNHFRSLNQRLLKIIMVGGRPQLAARLTGLHASASLQNRRELNLQLENLLAEIEGSEPDVSKAQRPRLLVAGSHFIDHKLMSTLADLGGEVVGVDSCLYDRIDTDLIKADKNDPIPGLAAGYLYKTPCPRMRANREHLFQIGSQTDNGDYDGIIFLQMKSCALHSYNLPVWRNMMHETGVPLLILEIEDGEWASPRTVTRLEAFLESLRG